MPFNIEAIFPNINTGLSNIGFFFGAGASKEAGYPLTNDLTKNVISKLNAGEQDILKHILDKESISYSFDEGKPDIEIISDLIYKYKLSSGSIKHDDLEKSIRDKIVEELISITNPNIELHIKFLKSLKALMSNRAISIFIFTTNYDLLFERAAMETQIPIYNGFSGTIFRYFDIERINLKYGEIENKHFIEYKEPNIKLIKLHGSISWFKKENKIFELFNSESIMNSTRSLILPKKQKIIDSLDHPYDRLFRYANQIIGNNCLYLISCGYSFRDEHINSQLIIPKLREGKIRFMALFKDEPANINQFKQFNAFNYITQNKMYFNGKETVESLEYWKFSNFVNLFSNKAGLGEI